MKRERQRPSKQTLCIDMKLTNHIPTTRHMQNASVADTHRPFKHFKNILYSYITVQAVNNCARGVEQV